MLGSPAFGQADLSNCERELIHLAGSVQPHGVLLALREPDLVVLQVSSNLGALTGVDTQAMLGQQLDLLGRELPQAVMRLCAGGQLDEAQPIRCSVAVGSAHRDFEGTLHRNADGILLLEIEPVDPVGMETVSLDRQQLLDHVGASVQRFSAASTIGTLADAVVRRFRDLTGYDRVMVYKFDPDGHGKIIAEARDPRLDPLLGHHYPATDIPQRARELYIRNRLRVLVNVHYDPAPLVPPRTPGATQELDMSLCHLRSMSPLHLQYLKNMGVVATLVISLVRQGQLWGLIACHHYAPRHLRFSLRSAADLLAEVVNTRIAAIENYVHAQVAIQVRRLEQRLIEATSTEGDWRLALFRNAHTLLQPLDATGAALFYEGEILTSGEVPSTPELRALAMWVNTQSQDDGLFNCSSVVRANSGLASLTPTASGVLAVRLSEDRADYLMWFRKEQLLSVTWAGDPSKPMVGDDPLELSPRRSFAAWSEIVRGSALPWSHGDLALARAFGVALIDIIVQVNAVRLLIAEHQLLQTRSTVANSREPVVIADARGNALFANDAFFKLTQRTRDTHPPVQDIARLFCAPTQVRVMLESLIEERQAWRGALQLDRGDGGKVDVTVRAELVPARDGSVLGFFLIFADLTNSQRAAAARERLEQSLLQAGRVNERPGLGIGLEGSALSHVEADPLMGAVLANASLAAMDVVDGSAPNTVAGMLDEIDHSTRRATGLYGRIHMFMGDA